MELALSLGDPSKQPFSFLNNKPQKNNKSGDVPDHHHHPLPLQLLPPSPLQQLRLHCLPSAAVSIEEPAAAGVEARSTTGGLDVNRTPWEIMVDDDQEEAAAALSSSSPNSGGMSCFQLEFGIRSSKRESEERERASSRTSDDEENGSTRKKLRLSKDQSAFLEESFKEHSTLNPKQKLALAKQLNLRPRQVEVWFQNRRARTKLKQTEVDCEHLKRCCETLTEENRRLQKEVLELRALKSSHPFYMQLPATTLTMCPSCERVATTTTLTATNTTAKLFPFPPLQPHARQTHQPT